MSHDLLLQQDNITASPPPHRQFCSDFHSMGLACLIIYTSPCPPEEVLHTSNQQRENMVVSALRCHSCHIGTVAPQDFRFFLFLVSVFARCSIRRLVVYQRTHSNMPPTGIARPTGHSSRLSDASARHLSLLESLNSCSPHIDTWPLRTTRDP